MLTNEECKKMGWQDKFEDIKEITRSRNRRKTDNIIGKRRNKGNNKITELRTILQRESQNS